MTTTTTTVSEIAARIAGIESDITEARDSLKPLTATAIDSGSLSKGTKVTEHTNLRFYARLVDYTQSSELRRLKKCQQKIQKLIYKRKRLMTDARKFDTRVKIQLGGLVTKAGLRDADKALILGCLMELQEQLQDEANPQRQRLETLRKAGSLALNEK